MHRKNSFIITGIKFLSLVVLATTANLSQALDVSVTGVPGSGVTTWVFNATEDTQNSSFSNRLNPINAASIGGNPFINEFEHRNGEINGEIVHGNPARQGNNAKGFLVSGGVEVSGRAYTLATNGNETDFDVDEIAIDNDTETTSVSQGFHIINGERIEVFMDVEEPAQSDDFVWGIRRARTFNSGDKIVFEDYTVTFNIDISEFGEGDTRIYVSGDQFTVSSTPDSPRQHPLTMSFEAVGPPTPIADLVAFDQLGQEIQIGNPLASLPTQQAGTTQAFTFNFLNRGELALDIQAVTIEGPDAAQFSLTLPDISAASDIPTDGTLDYTINFNPVGGTGDRNAVIRIDSNDLYTPSFNFNIHALAISSADDGDNDGLSDWAEFSLQGLGFDYTSNQDELVASLLNNAPAAGLFTRSELLGVQGSTVLVGTSETTADLVIGLESSVDLSTYTPIPLLPENLRIDEDGKIRYTLDSSVSSQFFRAGLEGN